MIQRINRQGAAILLWSKTPIWPWKWRASRLSWRPGRLPWARPPRNCGTTPRSWRPTWEKG